MSNERRGRAGWFGLLVAIVVTVALAPGLVTAQSGPPGPPPGRPTPKAGSDIFRLLTRLNLTPEQRASVDEIAKADRGARDVERQRLFEARRALTEKVHAATLDEAAIRQAASAVATLEADRAVATAKRLQQIRAVLTPEQRTQLDQMLTHVPAIRGDRGPRPPGPGAPRQPGAGS